MKKIFNLVTIFVCLIVFGTNIDVNADALAFKLICNDTDDVYQTFNGDVLECDIKATGNVVYFKDITLKYNFGEKFSLVKFVPNKDWSEVTNIDSGVRLTSDIGIPTNANFGTAFVKVNSQNYGGANFSITLENSEFGIDTLQYKVNLHDDNEKRLENVIINDGKLPIDFDSDVFEYNLSTTLETLNFELVTKNAVSLTDVKDNYKLNYGKNTIKIKVTDAYRNFENAKVYTFNITRNDNRSDNNSLSKLVVCGNEVSLVKGQYNYLINVGYDVEKAIIEYTLSDSSAKAELSGDVNLAFGKNPYVIAVTSEKGNTQIYNISIIKKEKVLSTNNYLSNIEIKGHSIHFKKNDYNYNVKIKNEKSLDIIVKTEDENASYQILGNDNLKNGDVVYINVNSESGSLLTYSIMVEEAESFPVYLVIISLLLVIIVVLVILLIVFMKKCNKINDKINNVNND